MSCPVQELMQAVYMIIVSFVVDMEGVIKSNTKGMKEIVTQLYVEIDKLRDSNKDLDRKIEKLLKENKTMERQLRLNEEDIVYLVKLNKPLEKAYKSLQRKFQKATDELEIRRKINNGK